MRKVKDRNLMMNEHEKSDRPVVPASHRNKGAFASADGGEGRGLAKGNPSQDNTDRTQCRGNVPSALERIRKAALRDRRSKFTALLHHVTIERLRSSYLRIRPRAAAGVDGITWQHYGKELQSNLEDLHARVHRGAYRAKPSRRVFIPKPDGRQRPLGIAALEDKVLQGAVAEVMNSIYEVDFVGFSYGFRPKRGAHDALDALAVGLLRKKVNWMLTSVVSSTSSTTSG